MNRFEQAVLRDEAEQEEAQIEDSVETLLEKLPEEIAERWYEAHTHLTPSERKSALEQFIKDRRNALGERRGSGSNPEHVAVVETSPQAVLKFIERIESGPHEKLGKGEAAHVIASVRYPNVCYKVMLPQEKVPRGTNDISTEADLQDEIAGLGEVAGVRAPKVFSFIHEGETRAISMERLDAVSLRDAIDAKKAVPANFEPERFMKALKQYITMLNEKGYYHRDLHEGNVMIDSETGMPYVIDFGFAKFAPIPEDAYECSVIEAGRRMNIVLPSDTASLEKLRAKADALGSMNR